MVALLFATTLSCSEALLIIGRVTKVAELSNQQRAEIIQVIKEHIPTCPFTVIPDERSKRSS